MEKENDMYGELTKNTEREYYCFEYNHPKYEGFFVEIVKKPSEFSECEYESWLCRHGYGIKEFLTSYPSERCRSIEVAKSHVELWLQNGEDCQNFLDDYC